MRTSELWGPLNMQVEILGRHFRRFCVKTLGMPEAWVRNMFQILLARIEKKNHQQIKKKETAPLTYCMSIGRKLLPGHGQGGKFRWGWDLAELWMKSSWVWMRSSQKWWDLAELWLRSSQVVRASGCQCQSCNRPRFYPSILRHSEIWGAAEEAVLNHVHKKKKSKKITP